MTRQVKARARGVVVVAPVRIVEVVVVVVALLPAATAAAEARVRSSLPRRRVIVVPRQDLPPRRTALAMTLALQHPTRKHQCFGRRGR